MIKAFLLTFNIYENSTVEKEYIFINFYQNEIIQTLKIRLEEEGNKTEIDCLKLKISLEKQENKKGRLGRSYLAEKHLTLKR